MVRLVGSNAPLANLKKTQQIAQYGQQLFNQVYSYTPQNNIRKSEPFKLPERRYTKEAVNAQLANIKASQANIDRDLQLDKDILGYKNQVLEERKNYVPPIPQVPELPNVVFPELSEPNYQDAPYVPNTTIPQTEGQGIGVDPTSATPPPTEQTPSPTVETNPQKEEKAQPGRQITIKESNYQPPPNYLQRQHFLMLVPSGHKDNNGYPIWYLEAYERNGGELVRVFQKPTRTGQLDGADSSVPGGRGRAPNGSYTVSAVKQAAASNGVGEFFIPISPQFSTKRSALGIHQDIGDDSTVGCLGLVNHKDLGVVYSFIKRFNGTQLFITDR